MSKDKDVFSATGTVIEVMRGAQFRIKMLENDLTITGIISGRMRKNNIRVLLGDTVEVEMSPYDLTKGRIVRRR